MTFPCWPGWLGHWDSSKISPRSRNHPLAQQEPCGQLLVVAGRSHHDGDTLTLDPDLERLFTGDMVVFDNRIARLVARD